MPDLQASRYVGSCLCGAVEFAVEGEARFVAHCHCENCRRAHGAGVVTWVGFPRAALALNRGNQQCARYVSDTGATWSFCATCGSRLFYEPSHRPDEVHIPAAALDEELDTPIYGHVYADRAPGWCPITDELRRFGGPSGMEPLD